MLASLALTYFCSSANHSVASSRGITLRTTKQPRSFSAALSADFREAKASKVMSGISEVFLEAISAVMSSSAAHVFSHDLRMLSAPYSETMACLMSLRMGSSSAVSGVYSAHGRIDEVMLGRSWADGVSMVNETFD